MRKKKSKSVQITLANVNLKYKIKNQTYFSLLKYNYFIFDEKFLLIVP